MILIGSKQNTDDFQKYGLQHFINADMDYEKALEEVEIYIGEEINPDKDLIKDNANARRNHFTPPKTLVFPEIEIYRNTLGDRGVQASLNVVPHEVGHYLQDKYFPIGHPKWKEIEQKFDLKIEYEWYFDKNINKWNSGGIEFAGNLFSSAIKLENTVTYFDEHKNKIIEINPHEWRGWFYNLWGQEYRIKKTVELYIGKTEYYINGTQNNFTVAPQIVDNRTMLELRDLLINVLEVKEENIKWDEANQKVTFVK